jgi:hypothetical protein
VTAALALIVAVLVLVVVALGYHIDQLAKQRDAALDRVDELEAPAFGRHARRHDPESSSVTFADVWPDPVPELMPDPGVPEYRGDRPATVQGLFVAHKPRHRRTAETGWLTRAAQARNGVPA